MSKVIKGTHVFSHRTSRKYLELIKEGHSYLGLGLLREELQEILPKRAKVQNWPLWETVKPVPCTDQFCAKFEALI